MKVLSPHYQAPQQINWYGREDLRPNERLYQWIQCLDIQRDQTTAIEQQFVFAGFGSDTGVARNAGRTGAQQGPKHLRKMLGNLAMHIPAQTIFDVGDILGEDDLESSQQSLSELVALLLQHHAKPFLFGGGHEIAWGHYQGIKKAFPNANIGIINIDAHFDMRPLINDKLGSSGTPFLQIANDCALKQKPFHYLCYGIQPFANTPSLYETAEHHRVTIITAEEIFKQQWQNIQLTIDDFIEEQDFIYLTICLDAFASDIAPGVSAPQSFGLYPWHVLPLIQQVAQSGKAVSADIAELSPDHDVDQKTTRLAANLVVYYLHHHHFNYARSEK